MCAVGLNRLVKERGREMVGEGERQAEHAGQLGAEGRRAEQPHLGQVPAAGNRRRVRGALARQKVANELDDVVGKVGRVEVRAAPKCARGDVISAGRATEAEIDAARMKRFEGGELFGNDERRVVGEHDATRAHAHRRRGVGEMSDQHGGRRARDRSNRVVLGHPEAPVAESFGSDREFGRLAKGLGGRRAGGDRREVENREGNHGWYHLKGDDASSDNRPPARRSDRCIVFIQCPRLEAPHPRALERLGARLWTTVAIFAALCVIVLVRAPQLLEPDDYAYRASIIALSEGHLLLTNAQYLALRAQLTRHGGVGIVQWVHLKQTAMWISQKNPGYPFFAVVFQWLHALAHHPPLLRRLRLRRTVLWRATLARTLGRDVRRRPLLHFRCGTDLRLARDDADLHRHFADRSSGRTLARRSAVKGRRSPSSLRPRRARLPRARWRRLHSLHRRGGTAHRARRCLSFARACAVDEVDGAGLGGTRRRLRGVRSLDQPPPVRRLLSRPATRQDW